MFRAKESSGHFLNVLMMLDLIVTSAQQRLWGLQSSGFRHGEIEGSVEILNEKGQRNLVREQGEGL